jgi:glycolate oxidase FAD binding subunit
MEGGNPVDADVVLSLRRMRGVLEYEPADVTLTGEAGLPLAKLDETTRAHGQWLPLDPPGWAKGSLGGLVATGVAGPLRQSYGTPRDHVLGLTLVTGDGRVLELGGRVVKNVAGFDLTRLSIGSWGTLGVVTAVSTRLFPRTERDVSLVFSGPDNEGVRRAARDLSGSSLPLGAVELLEGVDLPGSRGPNERPPPVIADVRDPFDHSTLVVRLLGSGAEVEEMERRVGEATEGLPVERREAKGSSALHERIARIEEGASLVLRVSLLPSKHETRRRLLGEFLTEFGQGTGSARTATHVGSGITRVAVPSLGGTGEDQASTMAAWTEGIHFLREAVEREGGSVRVCTGPPELVRSVGAWGDPGPMAEIHEKLKREFDPVGILSPGRFVV